MRSSWFQACRPRTLLLSVGPVFLGTVLAWMESGVVRKSIFLLTLLTASLLQILANLANDYGDAAKGLDTPSRLGPQRMVGSGQITPRAMQRAILKVIFLSVMAGSCLIVLSLSGWFLRLLFFGIGCLSIAAAITYTIGKRPYGYAGLGDLVVFIFFGWIAVLGSAYLQIQSISVGMWLPATATGFLATVILHINNLRDSAEDFLHGKRTLVVRWGWSRSLKYYLVLLLGAFVLFAIFAGFHRGPWNLLFLVALPPLLIEFKLIQMAGAPLPGAQATRMRFTKNFVHTLYGAFSTILLYGLGLILSQ